MKTIIRHPQFADKFESRIHFVFSPLHRIGILVPGKVLGSRTKGIPPGVAERVPVAYGKAYVIFQFFSGYHLILVIPFKGKGVV